MGAARLAWVALSALLILWSTVCLAHATADTPEREAQGTRVELADAQDDFDDVANEIDIMAMQGDSLWRQWSVGNWSALANATGLTTSAAQKAAAAKELSQQVVHAKKAIAKDAQEYALKVKADYAKHMNTLNEMAVKSATSIETIRAKARKLQEKQAKSDALRKKQEKELKSASAAQRKKLLAQIKVEKAAKAKAVALEKAGKASKWSQEKREKAAGNKKLAAHMADENWKKRVKMAKTEALSKLTLREKSAKTKEKHKKWLITHRANVENRQKKDKMLRSKMAALKAVAAAKAQADAVRQTIIKNRQLAEQEAAAKRLAAEKATKASAERGVKRVLARKEHNAKYKQMEKTYKSLLRKRAEKAQKKKLQRERAQKKRNRERRAKLRAKEHRKKKEVQTKTIRIEKGLKAKQRALLARIRNAKLERAKKALAREKAAKKTAELARKVAAEKKRKMLQRKRLERQLKVRRERLKKKIARVLKAKEKSGKRKRAFERKMKKYLAGRRLERSKKAAAKEHKKKRRAEQKRKALLRAQRRQAERSKKALERLQKKTTRYGNCIKQKIKYYNRVRTAALKCSAKTATYKNLCMATLLKIKVVWFRALRAQCALAKGTAQRLRAKAQFWKKAQVALKKCKQLTTASAQTACIKRFQTNVKKWDKVFRKMKNV